MRTLLALAMVAVMFMASGCETTSPFIKVDPAEAAPVIESGAALTTTIGLKALSSTPESWEKTKKAAKPIVEVIETTVIPFIQGQDLSKITKETADKILGMLNDKIPLEVRGVVQVAINAGMAFLKMPANPSQKLEPGQAEMILALMRGINAGTQAFLTWPGPGQRDGEIIPIIKEITWSGGTGP